MSSEYIETFYDVLGLPKTCTYEEIKRNYRTLALKYHPDKNLGNVEEATKKFNKIHEAYEILSDPQKRSWYENHMDVFHKDTVDISEYDIDPKYFTSSCYESFNDNENGFYTVYRQLFEDISAQEIQNYDDPKEFEYPSFGDSKTKIELVKYFYDMWQSFKTAVVFSQLDKYNIQQAPNRKIVRLMEKENGKIREQARKKRNMAIQKLVQILRKKDKRMEKYRDYLDMKNKDNREKSEFERRQKIKQNLHSSSTYVEPDWVSVQSLEQELKEIEANYDEDRSNLKKNKKKRKKQNFNCLEVEDIVDDDTSLSNIAQIKDEIEDNVPCTNSNEESLAYFCDVCNKKFKSINSFENHQKSKKHLNNLQIYRQIDNGEINK